MAKISITFKSPDAVDYALDDHIAENHALDKFEREDLKADLAKKLAKWISYGECITVEFDLDKGTATVR